MMSPLLTRRFTIRMLRPRRSRQQHTNPAPDEERTMRNDLSRLIRTVKNPLIRKVWMTGLQVVLGGYRPVFTGFRRRDAGIRQTLRSLYGGMLRERGVEIVSNLACLKALLTSYQGTGIASILPLPIRSMPMTSCLLSPLTADTLTSLLCLK
jgi:hypothetical protein